MGKEIKENISIKTQKQQPIVVAEGSELPDRPSEKKGGFEELRLIRLKHPNNIIVAYININYIRNEFENFSDMISEKIDVLAIAKSKIDSTFPSSQFETNGFKVPYRLDISGNCGGILVYVRENLISRRVDLLS